MPIYNAEATLSSCIKSIIQQKFTNFELILVNDASLDNTIKICEQFALQDNRIRLISNKINKGVSGARNTGLAHATGEWVAFVDADDMVSPDWLSDFFDLSQKPDLIIHPVELIIDEEHRKNIAYCVKEKTVEKTLLDLYKIHLIGFVWSMFYKKSIIKNNDIRFDERLKAIEDLEFTSHYCRYVKSIESFKKGTYTYRYPNGKHCYGGYNYCEAFFIIYNNFKNVFRSNKSMNAFNKSFAPVLASTILKVYLSNKNLATQMIIWYRRNMSALPLFLWTNGRLGFIGNLFIKLRIVWLVSMFRWCIRSKLPIQNIDISNVLNTNK